MKAGALRCRNLDFDIDYLPKISLMKAMVNDNPKVSIQKLAVDWLPNFRIFSNEPRELLPHTSGKEIFGQAVLGVDEQLVCRVCFNDLPGIHENGIITDAGSLLYVMSDHYDGHAFF